MRVAERLGMSGLEFAHMEAARAGAHGHAGTRAGAHPRSGRWRSAMRNSRSTPA